MNGQLSEQPLAELISEIFQKGLSGTLRLQNEGVRAVIYFDAGHVVYAASNLRELRLTEYLKKERLLTEAQLAALGKGSDLSLLADLSARGIADRSKIEPLISRQVSDLLRVLLLWTKGLWEFDDRSRLSDQIRIKTDVPELLVQAARKMPLEFVKSRFPNPDELISPVTKQPDFQALLPGEGFLLSRLEGTTKLRDLIAISGDAERETTRMIYGLSLSGFIKREEELNILGAAKATPSADSTSTAKTSAAVTIDQQPENNQPTQAESFEDLDSFLERIEAANNHYQALTVSNTALTEDIKSSYYKLARSYHPDKYHLQSATPLHGRLQTAFARITQAYETLIDSELRSAYDAKLAAYEKTQQLGKQGDPSLQKGGIGAPAKNDLERAENSFREGFAMLEQGRVKLAITNLAAAARLAPKEARYRAYHGRALAAEQRTRRIAEAELQAAIKLDPANASYRVMLAELYFDLGLFRRAEGELGRAISIDPNNSEAAQLMNRLEQSRTTK